MLKNFFLNTIYLIEILIITSLGLLNIASIIQVASSLYRKETIVNLYVGTANPIKLDFEQAIYILILLLTFQYLSIKWGELDKINYNKKISKIRPR